MKKVYSPRFRQEFVNGWQGFEGSFVEYCVRFGIPRQTGYEWLGRFESAGYDGLETRSSAPHSCPHATADDVAELVVAARKLHPTWGPRKLGPWLLERHPTVELPASSTMGELLQRAGLVPKRRRRRRTPRYTEPFAAVNAPNDVWTTDFKGQFHVGNGELCYPLTLCDGFSRFLLRCDVYPSPNASARKSFESAFVEYGLPRVIHSDNGTPFASTAPGGISKLSAWWIRLGIQPERSAPASPWENGRHERMHRTLKAEATKPPRATLTAQQRTLNAFRHEYNHERPHESLAQKPPATAYNRSPRQYPRKLPELVYPDTHELRCIDASGHLRWKGRKVFVSNALVGEVVGVVRTSDKSSDVYFGPLLLGALSDPRPDLGLLRYDRK